MKETLNELITLISTGCMGAEEIRRIADEAAQAYADPAGFLAANPDINYDDSFPIPLGEWVVVGSRSIPRTCRGSWRSASRPASMPRLPTKACATPRPSDRGPLDRPDSHSLLDAGPPPVVK